MRCPKALDRLKSRLRAKQPATGWDQDLEALADCARHLTMLLEGLANGQRQLLCLEMDGCGVPVLKAEATEPWYEALLGL